MQPQQPYYPPAPAPAPAPPSPGQYDFITGGSYQQPARYGGGNPKKMIPIVVIGALLLIGLVWFLMNMIFGGGGGNTTLLITAAQQQTEMIRVTEAADQADALKSQDTKNFATNLRLSLTTDKSNLVSLMSDNGVKVKDKELEAKQSSKTDSTLDAAKASGTYDSTYLEIMQDQLKAYQATLKQAYATVTNTGARQLLSDQFDDAQLLLEQSDQRS